MAGRRTGRNEMASPVSGWTVQRRRIPKDLVAQSWFPSKWMGRGDLLRPVTGVCERTVLTTTTMVVDHASPVSVAF